MRLFKLRHFLLIVSLSCLLLLRLLVLMSAPASATGDRSGGRARAGLPAIAPTAAPPPLRVRHLDRLFAASAPAEVSRSAGQSRLTLRPVVAFVFVLIQLLLDLPFGRINVMAASTGWAASSVTEIANVNLRNI